MYFDDNEPMHMIKKISYGWKMMQSLVISIEGIQRERDNYILIVEICNSSENRGQTRLTLTNGISDTNKTTTTTTKQ